MQFNGDRGHNSFQILVAHVLQQQLTAAQYISYPAPLFGEDFSSLPQLDDVLKNPGNFTVATSHDWGFMYKIVHRGDAPAEEQLAKEMIAVAKSKQAVFWPIDGY